MKKKYKIIWFIIKYSIEKFFLKNFEMYAPSVAGSSKTKGKITIDNINRIFPMISTLISNLGFRKKIINSKSFCISKKKLQEANKLKNLFNKHGSDKSSVHDYHYIYSSIFKNPTKIKNILEVGIGTNDISMLSNMGGTSRPGASLRTFRDYFKKSMVYGADIDKKILFKDTRIVTRYVDQTDPKSISKLFKYFGCKFDLIIDDGLHSHITNLNLIINSMKFLKKNGCLVIEDISLSSRAIWETISAIVGVKYKCFLIKCNKSYIFLIYN